MGHEIAGVVEQIGEGVSNIEPGDRVGVHWILACGDCPFCQMGEEESCIDFLTTLASVGGTRDGGYAEYVTVPAARVIPLPPKIDFVEAAPLFCAGLTMYGGCKNAGLQPGQRVAVLGIGGLGHLAIQVAKALDAEVIAVTSTESKSRLAKRLGADDVISETGAEWGQKLMEMGGANVVLSTTVDADAIAPAMQGLLPQGTLVLMGITMEPLHIIPSVLLGAQYRVIGSNVGSSQEQRELLQLAVDHNIRPMSEVYCLDDANIAHQRLRANKVRFRAVLVPN
jgi:D-arabinose 1-dehydrogenase-like Zn-dependent alcohol dehydrogenase